MAIPLPFNLPKGSILSGGMDTRYEPSPYELDMLNKQDPQINIPTKADSLALYNNSKKVMDYYIKKKYNNDDNVILKNRNSKYFYNNLDSLNKEWIKNNFSGSGTTIPLDDKAQNIKNLPEDTYRKIVDKNKFFQRESAHGILDTRAPMQLYDRRIAPTQRSLFSNQNRKDALVDDFVEINTYDPVLIKPVSMLTPEEKALRLKRYGKNSGIKEEEETIAQPTQKNENTIEKELNTEEQAIPYNYDDEDAERIFAPVPSGGGGAFVGIKKKDGTIQYVKPEDYKRMGVPNYGKEYIQNAIGAALANILGQKRIK
jgi:hypothetical protein